MASLSFEQRADALLLANVAQLAPVWPDICDVLEERPWADYWRETERWLRSAYRFESDQILETALLHRLKIAVHILGARRAHLD